MSKHKLHILPEPLINQIAAGEVIERPASVVKELIENAIDAESTDILIELRDAGRTKIGIYDNGIGMNAIELDLCVERHATSKISELEDLFKVKTLGFRGEALPSIGAISKLTLTSRDVTDEMAHRLQILGGKKENIVRVGGSRGTAIEVESLFYNVPARLKFLKSDTTELSRSTEIIIELALSHPEISFRCTHQGRKILHYVSAKEAVERVLQVFSEKKDHFVEFEEEFQNWKIKGFVGKPHLLSSSAKYQYMYVHGRSIRDRTLLHAISVAYQTFVPAGMFPKVVIFLEPPPNEIDVNVHPTKREVRFKNAHFVHQLVEQSIKRALSPQYSPARETHYSEKSQVDTLSFPKKPGIYSQNTSENYLFEPKHFEQTTKSVYSNIPQIFGQTENLSKAFFSKLRYIGQLKMSYLICEDEGNLIFIDQHAAHERVTFERLKQQDAQKNMLQVQRLLFPLTIELTVEEAILMTDLISIFLEIGFEIEPFGGHTYVIKGVPKILFGKISEVMIRKIIEECKEAPKTEMGESIVNHYLATVACHASRTANEKLEVDEIHILLRSLDALTVAPHCPHGRPFSFSLPIQEIEKKFYRA